MVWTLFLIPFGLLIIYQILVKVFGGSWISEALILTLLAFNVGYTIRVDNRVRRMEVKLARLEIKIDNIEKQFQSLAHDFKEHVKQTKH